MENKKMFRELNTVRKKVLLLSKLTGGTIVIFYLITSELPADHNIAFWSWFVLMIGVILGVDFMLGKMISKPLKEIRDTARRMAELDFTAHCTVHTKDEFGELSQSLNKMSANLQEALEQRKELADSLSHEMKTPLGLIRAYTEGLKEETDEQKKLQYMDSILSAADRMNDLIVSLLELSALESGAAKLTEERFDFIELAETVAGRLLVDAPGINFSFSYELPEQKVFVLADKRRMEQVVGNLIENAKKYVRPGGEIRLTIACAERHLDFSIFNHGDVIPERELPRIWEKFYRGENSASGGSGLGLAMAAQILSLYHAPYGVRNHTDGVEFYFRFSTIL